MTTTTTTSTTGSPVGQARATRSVPLVGDVPAMREWAAALVDRARTEGVPASRERPTDDDSY